MTTKQELKQCFERIEPSEALIRDTLRRMQEVREGRESAPVRMPSFAFGYRLVGALCALLLVLSVGVVFVGRTGLPNAVRSGVPTDEGAPLSISEQPHEGDAHEITAALTGCEDMIERAKAYGEDYAVLAGVVESMYFVHADEAVALIAPQTIAQMNVTKESLSWENAESGTLAVTVRLSDVELVQQLVDAVALEVLVGAHAEQTEQGDVWVLHEIHFVQEATE